MAIIGGVNTLTIMNIKTKKSKDILTFILDGELDEHASHDARKFMDKALDKTGAASIVFDLNRLSFMDSTGIGVLLGRYKKIRDTRKAAYITGANSTVSKILTAGGIYRVMQRLE